MKIRVDKPIGKLISSIPQQDGSILETYEVEVLGVKCHYLHFAEFIENTELYQTFTQSIIILN